MQKIDAQYKYLIAILVIALAMTCSRSHADDRTGLHIGANFAATFMLYQFLNAAFRQEKFKESLLIAAPMMLTIGVMMEVMQAGDRNSPVDTGDIGANALGVAGAAATILVFDL